MIYGFLACTTDGYIGNKNKIPWHHRGDLKRFSSLTKGSYLIMGPKTYLGLAEHYTKPESVVLPGRKIFVVGRPRSSEDKLESSLLQDLKNVTDKLGVLTDNVIPIIEMSPEIEIIRMLTLSGASDIFIAGGASIYQRYLKFAEKIYLTEITARGYHFDTKLHHSSLSYLSSMKHKMISVEVEGDIIATYYELTPS